MAQAVVLSLDTIGLPDWLCLPQSHREGEASDEERRGDPCHGVGAARGGGGHGPPKPLQVHGPEAAEGEDPLAQLSQQLPEGQCGRTLTQRRMQPQDQNDGETLFS